MEFETHIFISYGHVDNQNTSEEEGWVSRFEERLRPYLSFELGENAKIWRDSRNRGNDVFAEEILDRLRSTAAAIAVLTPRYTRSDWCLREAEEFCRAAEQNGGLVVGNKARFFPVALKPLEKEEREKLPPRLGDMLGYPFYQEVEGGRHERLDPALGSEQLYSRRLMWLAIDIADVIKRLRAASAEAAAVAPAPGDPQPPTAAGGKPRPVVYLAECGYDRLDDRERLWAELRAHGYAVLPPNPESLPDVEPLYLAAVEQMLAEAQLAIHLVGDYPGKTPDGPTRKPAVELQAEIAARLSAERGLQRVIWMPEGTRSEGWSFPEALLGSADLQRGADLLTGGFEELKSTVHGALRRLEEPTPAAPPPPVGAEVPSVYVVCVEEDFDALTPLADCLSAAGIAMELPVFSGSAAAVREANEAIALRCDTALLFFGAGDGAWMAQQRSELFRLQALRRATAPITVYTCLAGDRTPDKRAALLRRTPNLIDLLDGFSPAAMDPLVAELKPRLPLPVVPP